MNDNDNNPEKHQIYFAARDSNEAAGAILQKASTYYNEISSNSYITKLTNMYKFYYGNFSKGKNESHTINFTGEEGELVSIPINMFRNLARHIINIITANRPVFEASAINTDYKSLSQTYLATGILDYYMREKNLETIVYDAVEMATVMGASYIDMEWNATAGTAQDFDPETGEHTYEGELEFTLYDPLSVVVDGTKENFYSQEWALVRKFENRYNLAAKYPEFRDKIMALPTKNTVYGYKLASFSNDDTDDIPVFKFYHKKTSAMPEGRYMLFVSKDVVLLDVPLPYRVMPLFRLTPSGIMGTPYGYSDMFDVYPIQEALNSVYSTILTNNDTFGVQNLYVQRGADLSHQNLGGGLNIVEGNSKPEPLQLTATAPETYKFAQILEQLGETQSGINSVTRGNPEASLRSGNSLALVQSMSLQFQNTFQRNYVRFLEELGSNLIEILKDFADTPRMIAIVGKNKRSFMKEFTGDMISDVRRMTVAVGNPLAKSIAGRLEIANNLANMKLIKTPEQYFAVMETGRVDTLYEAEMQDIFLIKRENEDMLEGKQVFADILDRHSLHILEHRSVISDPDLRANPELTANVRNHIQEHIDMLRNVNPDLLMLIKEQPLNPEQFAGNPSLPPGPNNPQGGPPPGLPPSMGNQQSTLGSTTDEIMDPSMMGSQQSSANLPNQPSVDADLLVNPDLEPRAQ